MDIKNELEKTIQSLALSFENNSKEQNKEFIEELDKRFSENESLYVLFRTLNDASFITLNYAVLV